MGDFKSTLTQDTSGEIEASCPLAGDPTAAAIHPRHI